MRTRGLVLALLVLSVALAGCTDDLSGLDGESSQRVTPRDATQVSNQPGSFSIQGGMWLQTYEETYTWTNPAPIAEVHWQGAAADGTFRITIQDQTGQRTVYEAHASGTQAWTGSSSTDPGVPGQWSITLSYTNFTGSMQLNVQSG